MEITVAICTWNRAAILDQTLGELRQVHIPQGLEWELLVVNNNCTDATDAVLDRHAAFLPIRRLSEPTPGKANAANLAVREARGDLLVWTDDDVSPCREWLEAYRQAAADSPQVDIFGGPIEPWFDGQPPAWLVRVQPQIAKAFGTRDPGSQPLPLTRESVPYGANYAVRTDVLRRFPFNPGLGVSGRRRIGGYETSVIRQMLMAGISGLWVPAAGVRHFVRRETQTVKFLRRYYAGLGHAAVLNARFTSGDTAAILGAPWMILPRALKAEARFRWSRLTSAPEVWVESLIESSILWGALRRSEGRAARRTHSVG
ncbi:MAG: glycosyltransferase family 2 protein [Planctomycetaceae bacterium]|nr:glycosyltransferase family 2 protein [Planctomycetaceae bacterium]